VKGFANPCPVGTTLPGLYPAERHRGHKKEHLLWIKGHVPDWARSFGEPFGGTGIVGWFAKTCGLQVFTNDVMAFAHLRAKVLIVNGKIALDDRDIEILEQTNLFRLGVAEEWYGSALGGANAAWLDNFAANLPMLGDPVKQDVAAYIAIICLMGRMNYSQVTFSNDRRFAGKRYLDRFTWGTEFRRHAVDKFPLLLHDNGRGNEACRGDALEFVRSHRFDCLYMDPPFVSPVKYEQDLAFYDKLVLVLEGRHTDIGNPYNGPVLLPPHTKFYDRNKGLIGMAGIFRAAGHVSRIILSYNTTSGIHPDEIASDGERLYGPLVVREQKPVQLHTVNPSRPRMTNDVLLVFDRR